jgi:hypothetical protein
MSGPARPLAPKDASVRGQRPFVEVLEACGHKGCPICAVVHELIARRLQAVIHEHVTDPATRDAVVRAGGLCNAHSWLLRSMPAALGTALIYRSVIAAASERLSHYAPPHTADGAPGWMTRWRTTLGALWGRRGSAAATAPCPLCLERDRYERIYLTVLLDHIAEPELCAAFRNSGGLCFPHVQQLLHLPCAPSALATLIAEQRALDRNLCDELGLLIRANDYRFAGEPLGEAGDSWVRAIERVAGRQGIR